MSIALIASLLVPTLCLAVEAAEATAPPEPAASPSAPAEELPATPDPTAPEASPTPQPSPEPDFIVGDWELRKVAWKHLRLNGGPLLPIKTVGPQDSRGVPMRPLGPGGKLVYNPTVLAQQGLKRLDAYVRTGNTVHLRQARKYADVLDDLATGNRKRRWQPHDYDLSDQGAGWVNANSHGLVLSFLSRFHSVVDSPQRLADAELLLAAFEQREGNKRWISTVTGGDYLWFEHWPDGRFEHTLNAHLNAMFGLYDYWLATGSPLAEQYFLGGAATVREKLYRFRRKDELSRYSLSGTVGSLHYHDTHVDQLRILARIDRRRLVREAGRPIRKGRGGLAAGQPRPRPLSRWARTPP